MDYKEPKKRVTENDKKNKNKCIHKSLYVFKAELIEKNLKRITRRNLYKVLTLILSN